MSPRNQTTGHDLLVTLSLLLIALLGSLFHLIGIIYQGSALLYSDMSRLVVIYSILAISAAAGAYLALRRDRFMVRIVATLALLANLGSIVYVASNWSGEMHRMFGDLDMTPIPPGQVGIVVCPMDTSGVAVEWAHQLEDQLQRTIEQAKVSPYMIVRHGYPVQDAQQAHKLGNQLRANVVVWSEPPSGLGAARYHVTILGASETELSLEPYNLMLLLATQDTFDLNSADLHGENAPSVASILAPVASGYGFLAVGQPMIAASQFQSITRIEGLPVRYMPIAHTYLGRAMLFVQRDDLAEEQFRQANLLEPTSGAWVGLGLVELMRDNWSGARFGFNQALAADPYDSTAYCGQGIVLAQDRAVARAIAVYRQAISLDEMANVPYALLGMAYELAADIDQAVAAYKSAAVNAGPNVGLQLAVTDRAERIQRNPPTAIPTATPLPMPTVTPIPTRSMYVVERGDTLQNIATEFEVTVEEIVTLNQLTDPNALYIGQLIIIPSKKK